MEKSEVDFQTEVLTRLGIIESKLDGYKEIKKLTYDNKNSCDQNSKEIIELKSRVNNLEQKPNKRYESVINQIITFFVGIVLTIIAIKIGLK